MDQWFTTDVPRRKPYGVDAVKVDFVCYLFNSRSRGQSFDFCLQRGFIISDRSAQIGIQVRVDEYGSPLEVRPVVKACRRHVFGVQVSQHLLACRNSRTVVGIGIHLRPASTSQVVPPFRPRLHRCFPPVSRYSNAKRMIFVACIRSTGEAVGSLLRLHQGLVHPAGTLQMYHLVG